MIGNLHSHNVDLSIDATKSQLPSCHLGHENPTSPMRLIGLHQVVLESTLCFRFQECHLPSSVTLGNNPLFQLTYISSSKWSQRPICCIGLVKFLHALEFSCFEKTSAFQFQASISISNF